MIILKVTVIYETNMCSINLSYALELLHRAEKKIFGTEREIEQESQEDCIRRNL
jgi:hypothetical protein